MRPEHVAPENPGLDWYHSRHSSSFNEAGARGSGKQPDPDAQHAAGHASMRPEHVAPENAATDLAAGRTLQASMRPEHVAPENDHGIAGQPRGATASMRPEHVAPENVGGGADG